jgi:paraquat-inducible protein B
MKSNKDYTDILVEGIAIADPQLAQQYANAQKQLNDKDAQIIALQKQINNLETQKMQLQKAMIAIEQKASQAIPKTPVTTPASTPQTNQTTQPAQTTTQNQPQTTTESFHDILKITPINEELFDITNAEDDELESLKNFMDSENIEYYEDPEEETIEFDKDMLDYEWKNSLEDIGLV